MRDIAPLENKWYLVELNVQNNPISSLKPIEGSTMLELLNIENTQISDLGPLSKMNNLITLPTYPIYIVELPIQLALDTVLIPFDWLNTPSCPEGYQKEF